MKSGDFLKKDINVDALISEIRIEDHDYFRSSTPRYKRVREIFKNKPIGKILDLGCSPGHNAIILSRMGFEVIGIDLNDIYISKYNPGWFKEFDRITWDIEKKNLPFESDSFEYVIFSEVLEHVAIRHPKEIFQELKRVLKPGGMLYLTTPNVANLSYVLALLFGNNIFWNPEIFYGSTDRHNREYTHGEVRKLLKDSGFNNIIINFYSTWSNNKCFPLRIIGFLINNNFNNRVLDNTIEATAIK